MRFHERPEKYRRVCHWVFLALLLAVGAAFAGGSALGGGGAHNLPPKIRTVSAPYP